MLGCMPGSATNSKTKATCSSASLELENENLLPSWEEQNSKQKVLQNAVGENLAGMMALIGVRPTRKMVENKPR